MGSLKIPVDINLTGGEPLCYPGLFELVEYLVSFGNLEELNLITNACDIDDNTISRIADSGISSLKVSLESHILETNDSIRGAGHFDTVTRNVRRLRLSKLPVILMVTLGSYNYEHIPGLCRLASELGAGEVIFERFVPLGHGLGQRDSVLSANQWLRVLSSIAELTELDMDINDLLPYKAFRLDLSEGYVTPGLSGALCNLGPSSMALMPDGTVFPCRRLPTPVGKLPHDHIFDILSKLEYYSPANLSKVVESSKCSVCFVKDCAGCRALAVALGGELSCDDEQCPGPA